MHYSVVIFHDGEGTPARSHMVAYLSCGDASRSGVLRLVTRHLCNARTGAVSTGVTKYTVETRGVSISQRGDLEKSM